jgi:hypothetical protein
MPKSSRSSRAMPTAWSTVPATTATCSGGRGSPARGPPPAPARRPRAAPPRPHVGQPHRARRVGRPRRGGLPPDEHPGARPELDEAVGREDAVGVGHDPRVGVEVGRHLTVDGRRSPGRRAPEASPRWTRWRSASAMAGRRGRGMQQPHSTRRATTGVCSSSRPVGAAAALRFVHCITNWVLDRRPGTAAAGDGRSSRRAGSRGVVSAFGSSAAVVGTLAPRAVDPVGPAAAHAGASAGAPRRTSRELDPGAGGRCPGRAAAARQFPWRAHPHSLVRNV